MKSLVNVNFIPRIPFIVGWDLACLARGRCCFGSYLNSILVLILIFDLGII